MDMHLRYFYEAAQLGSMRAAGEKLGVAVSSISRQIAQLENELGLLLLERGRRTIKLTEAGELALSYYRKSLAEREVFDCKVRDLRGLRAGRLDLAVGEGFVTSAFSEMMNGFITKHPGFQVVTTTGTSTEVIRMVVEDEVHGGLVFQTPTDPKVRVKAAVHAPIMLLARFDHPIAALDRVTLAEISKYPVGLMPDDFLIRQALAKAERAEGVWLQPAITSNSLQLLKEMAKSGDCLTVLPVNGAISELLSGSLKAIPIATSLLENTTICLITRLGRQLPTMAARLLCTIEANLHKWADATQAQSGHAQSSQAKLGHERPSKRPLGQMQRLEAGRGAGRPIPEGLAELSS